MNHTDFLMVANFINVATTHPTTGLVGFRSHQYSTYETQVGTEPHRSELNTTKGDTK